MILDRIAAAVAAFLDPALIGEARGYRVSAAACHRRDVMPLAIPEYDEVTDSYVFVMRELPIRQEDQLRRSLWGVPNARRI